MLKTKLLSSLHKVFPDELPCGGLLKASALRNEAFSFQVAYCAEEKESLSGCTSIPLYVETECELPISAYRVDYVPLLRHTPPEKAGDTCGGKTALYPDMLLPRGVNSQIIKAGYPWEPHYCEVGERNPVNAIGGVWQSLWFTVNDGGKQTVAAGSHKITVKLFSRISRECLATLDFTLEIIDALLPPQRLMYTNWLHCDCIADMHNVKLFDDAFFEILQDYAAKGALNGMNTVLLPAFTPPLDTYVGGERKTAQLVKVKAYKNSGETEYRFDFSLMKRFIDVCTAAGTAYFEHCHLFTQWGAEYAPKIIAETENGEEQIFGWETEAMGEDYKNFLSQYLIDLQKFLESENLTDRVFYHISDEPPEKSKEHYKAAKEYVEKYIGDTLCTDAASDYSLYSEGIIKELIVAINFINHFIDKCDNMWCYYTGDETDDNLSSRLIENPSYRNRVIGMQMYRYGIKGFLSWGYNYCYGAMSYGVYDCCCTPTMTGGSHVVYPGRDGTAIQSLRLKVFGEGIYDMRALQLLESLIGKEKTCTLLDGLFGEKLTFNTRAVSAEQLLQIRTAINKAIAENLPLI